MLLATAIDMGRAFFTWEVVHKMAAEGAAYLSRYPTRDNPGSSPSWNNDSYQVRAMNVGKSAGRIFDASGSNFNPTTDVTTTVTTVSQRCLGTQFKVMVNYHMTDLFIPAFFGVKQIHLGAEETSAFLANATGCPP
jgi:hypothetical protein